MANQLVTSIPSKPPSFVETVPNPDNLKHYTFSFAKCKNFPNFRNCANSKKFANSKSFAKFSSFSQFCRCQPLAKKVDFYRGKMWRTKTGAPTIFSKTFHSCLIFSCLEARWRKNKQKFHDIFEPRQSSGLWKEGLCISDFWEYGFFFSLSMFFVFAVLILEKCKKCKNKDDLKVTALLKPGRKVKIGAKLRLPR